MADTAPQRAQAVRGLEPLRIAVLSLHTSPLAPLGLGGNGGMNVYVREVCRAFSGQGVRTDVFTLAPGDRARIEPLAQLSRVISVPAGPAAADKYALLENVPQFVEWILRFLEREDYGLVYSHYWLSGAAAARLRPLTGLPWAHTAHTLGLVKNRSLAAGATPEPPSRIAVEREIARDADLLVASTEAEREDLIRSHGALGSRVTVVAPGVDLARFAPQPERSGPPYLLFVGRLEPLKGAETALRSFALVARANPRLSLLVIGDDSAGSAHEKARLGRVAEELGIAERVRFEGSVPHEKLPRHYSSAVACLVPSYSESFGLVALEAQACGCPVVASDLPGLASIVRDGVTGYLIENHDAAAYADRLTALLADPELRRQMGRHAHLLAQRFTWSRTAQRLLSQLQPLAVAPVLAPALAES